MRSGARLQRQPPRERVGQRPTRPRRADAVGGVVNQVRAEPVPDEAPDDGDPQRLEHDQCEHLAPFRPQRLQDPQLATPLGDRDDQCVSNAGTATRSEITSWM